MQSAAKGLYDPKSGNGDQTHECSARTAEDRQEQFATNAVTAEQSEVRTSMSVMRVWSNLSMDSGSVDLRQLSVSRAPRSSRFRVSSWFQGEHKPNAQQHSKRTVSTLLKAEQG